MKVGRYVVLVSLMLLLSLALSAQDPTTMTARELFYAVTARRPVPAQPPRTQPAPATIASQAPAPVPAVPLALRYSVLKMNNDQFNEVDASSTFITGDQIKMSVQVNDPAYLYVVQRGSSGRWGVLFPTSDLDNGNNFVQPAKPYDLPSGSNAWRFREPAGIERVFIVASRQPIADLHQLIYSLSAPPSPAAPAAPPAPAPRPAVQENPQQPVFTIAQNLPTIADELIVGLRNGVRARDLVFEKTDTAVGSTGEHAVYVANRNLEGDGRVVAEVSITHR